MTSVCHWCWSQQLLNKAPLRGDTLFGVDLRFADFRDADLRKADRFAVDLIGAVLAGADARGAKLDMTIGFDQHQLDAMIGDETTQLPRGLEHPQRWNKSTQRKVRVRRYGNP